MLLSVILQKCVELFFSRDISPATRKEILHFCFVYTFLVMFLVLLFLRHYFVERRGRWKSMWNRLVLIFPSVFLFFYSVFTVLVHKYL